MSSKGDVKEKLMACLRELHLPTFRECFEELARRAVQETASYEQYLLELAERECQARWAKRTERLLRDSRLPLEKDLASFDMARLPAKVSRQVRTLIEGSFVDRRENLLLFGKTGTANIAKSDERGYSDRDYIASFIAGAPAEEPAAIVLVSIRKPNIALGKGYTGGTVAAPVAAHILEKTLSYLENH